MPAKDPSESMATVEDPATETPENEGATSVQTAHPSGLRRVQLFIATGMGSGLSPVAPGTAGTALAIFLFLPFVQLAATAPWLYLATVLGLTALGIWAAHGTDEHFGSHDDPRIVIDEIAGYFAALAWVPYSWKTALVAFAVFRVLDVFKIWPANVIDRKLPGGIGVVLDDVMVGIYTNLVLQLLAWQGWLP